MRIAKMALVLTLLAAVASAASSRMAYLYKHNGHSTISTNGMSLHSVVRNAERWDGDFIWAHVDGQSYVIRDRGVLDEAARVYAVADAGAPAVEDAARKLRPLEERVDDLDEQIDDVSDSLDDESLSDAERERLETKLRELERQHRDAEAEMRPVERESERLEREHDRIEDEADAQLEALVRRAIANDRAEKVAD